MKLTLLPQGEKALSRENRGFLGWGDWAERARRQVGGQVEGADAVAVEGGDGQADGGEHAADLVVTAFGDGEVGFGG